MSFSTPVFLFLFFPLTILGYYLIHPKLQNAFLLLASLAFYAWGEPKFVVVFLTAILFNYLVGRLLGIMCGLKNSRRMVMLLGLAANIGLLFYYKYLIFGTEIVNSVFNAGLTIKEIALPFGISFFTFRSISYILDVYWGISEAQKNPVNVALYISFFPQVSMGPITKSNVFLDQINNRHFDLDMFTDGAKRFISGLAKKLIIADTLGVIVDPVFLMAGDERTVVAAWYGMIGYCLQLYFDFSGYTDMAIGLSKMFGFATPENFDYPYMAISITDFWRRWHITLGEFFKNYVYFPLGGSRKGNVYVNIFIVFLLTGIWHGAAWSFIVWGLWHGLFRLIEMWYTRSRKDYQIPSVLQHLYALIVVAMGWVLFRASDLLSGVKYWGNLLGIGAAGMADSYSLFTLQSTLGIFIIGIIFCFPVAKKIREFVQKQSGFYVFAKNFLMPIVYVGLLLLCVAYMQIGTYNPFLYNNF